MGCAGFGVQALAATTVEVGVYEGKGKGFVKVDFLGLSAYRVPC